MNRYPSRRPDGQYKHCAGRNLEQPHPILIGRPLAIAWRARKWRVRCVLALAERPAPFTSPCPRAHLNLDALTIIKGQFNHGQTGDISTLL